MLRRFLEAVNDDRDLERCLCGKCLYSDVRWSNSGTNIRWFWRGPFGEDAALDSVSVEPDRPQTSRCSLVVSGVTFSTSHRSTSLLS